MQALRTLYPLYPVNAISSHTHHQVQVGYTLGSNKGNKASIKQVRRKTRSNGLVLLMAFPGRLSRWNDTR